jgi:hypothetical protein
MVSDVGIQQAVEKRPSAAVRSMRRTQSTPPFLIIACRQVSRTVRALRLVIFEQPVYKDFFNILFV